MTADGAGHKIDRYVVEGVLGAGSTGVVLRARHSLTHAEVAIELLRPGVRSRPDLVERFLAGAWASARLDHPGIVPVADAGTTPEGDPDLVIELLQGEPLSDAEWTSLMATLSTEPHRAPSAVVAGAGPELDAFVARALAKDPTARYASADEMAAALEALPATQLVGLAEAPTPEPSIPARALPDVSSLTARLGLSAQPPARDRALPVASKETGMSRIAVGAGLAGLALAGVCVTATLGRSRHGHGGAAIVATPAVTPVSSTRATPGLCPEAMVDVAGGTFKMGDRGDTVTVKSYRMDVSEVTTDCYAACVGSGRCSADVLNTSSLCNYGAPGRGDHPINCVDLNQAQTFCRAHGWRLPTEEEWEWAARGGARAYAYPWGNAPPSNQACWNGEGSDLGQGKRRGTCPVGSFRAGDSPLGIHDLAGNVWEWTTSDYDAHAPVFRGGAWNFIVASYLHASTRYRVSPSYRYNNLGFRCARDLP